MHTIRRLTIAALAALAAAGATTADADAPVRGSLASYSAPADYLQYVPANGGAYRPPLCPEIPGVGHPVEIAVFTFNGAPMGNEGAPTSTALPDKTLWNGQGGVVVWNGATQRWRNYTDQPVIVAGWCARVTG